ncbi:MAG: triose-phosphate isomerase [Candidatus Moranbacteria bacterium RBG_19FT_COMBO_42_6]|nr:MAG: triose-phosphate isomerase [Candidatus Moranbacteria bacterium RBG_19FT_COMBO_42_6]
MNLINLQERERYFRLFEKELAGKKFSKVEVILCPPFVHLESFKKWIGKKIKLGAQNMFAEPKGSYTGEISPLMLRNFGCAYVILGHSERRRYFSEKNEEIGLKVVSALKNGLIPVICVGETKVQREEHKVLDVITEQVAKALLNISRTKAGQLVIAYEPVWAVGSDLTPTAHEIMEVKVLIRKILVALFGNKYADEVKILYGGSVKAATVKEVCLDPGMDGVLVGRESLTPHEFLKITAIINEK